MPDVNPEVQPQQEAATLSADEFRSLLVKNVKPSSDRMKEEIEVAVQTLA